jgi:antitoxin StbD
MNQILSSYSVSISELKKNPSALINESGGQPIAVLNHNKPTAYLISAETFENIVDSLDDIELNKLALKRLNQKEKAVDVNINDL